MTTMIIGSLRVSLFQFSVVIRASSNRSDDDIVSATSSCGFTVSVSMSSRDGGAAATSWTTEVCIQVMTQRSGAYD